MRLLFPVAAASVALLAQAVPAQAQSAAPAQNREVFPVESPREAPAGPSRLLGGSGETGLDSVGTAPFRDTHFDRKIWRDTPFNLILQLIEKLPGRVQSAAQHELTKNLLIAIADAPPGDDQSGKILTKRVLKLLEMGNVEDAGALARAAPGLPSDPALAQAAVAAELLANQVETACLDLRAIAQTHNQPWTEKGLLLCRMRAGETIEGGVPPMDVKELGALAKIGRAHV